jgi:hypothetical protein
VLAVARTHESDRLDREQAKRREYDDRDQAEL